jgi:membrane-associated PAP2 superfamily phosphatase
VPGRRFWLLHAVWPGLLFGLFATAAATTGFDESLTRAWAFTPATGHFIGSGAGEWWAKELIHSAGGRAIRIVGGLLLLLWGLSFLLPNLRRWRRPAGFVVLCAVLGAGVVGLLKQTTNVDCPWALA